MKKSLSLVIIFIFILSGCGKSTNEFDKDNILPDKEEYKLYSSPEDYIGKSVDMNFVLSDSPEYDKKKDGYFAFGNTSGDNYSSLKFTEEQFKNSSLNAGDSINIKGVIETDLSDDEGRVYPRIVVSEVKKVAFDQAMKPALYSYKGTESKTLQDVTMKLDKVEFAKEETRVYLTITNNSKVPLTTAWVRPLVVDGQEITGSNTSDVYFYNHDNQDEERDPLKISPGKTATLLTYYPEIDYKKASEITLDTTFMLDGTPDLIEGFDFNIPLK